MSKPCTLLTANITGKETKIGFGYNMLKIVSKMSVSLEKVELSVKRV